MLKAEFEKFKTFYEQHMPQIYSYIHSRTYYNTALTEDLVSEIFLKALEKFDTFDEKTGSFKSWIFRVAKNHLIDHFKSKKNQANVSLDDVEMILPDKSNTEENANDEIEKEKLIEAIENLPDDKKELIKMRFFGEYSYKEMSDMLKEDENKIRVTVFRTLKDLKRKLFELQYQSKE